MNEKDKNVRDSLILKTVKQYANKQKEYNAENFKIYATYALGGVPPGLDPDTLINTYEKAQNEAVSLRARVKAVKETEQMIQTSRHGAHHTKRKLHEAMEGLTTRTTTARLIEDDSKLFNEIFRLVLTHGSALERIRTRIGTGEMASILNTLISAKKAEMQAEDDNDTYEMGGDDMPSGSAQK